MCIEHEDFKKKAKDHYKGEFNMATLLKAKVNVDEEEEEDLNAWSATNNEWLLNIDKCWSVLRSITV